MLYEVITRNDGLLGVSCAAIKLPSSWLTTLERVSNPQADAVDAGVIAAHAALGGDEGIEDARQYAGLYALAVVPVVDLQLAVP